MNSTSTSSSMSARAIRQDGSMTPRSSHQVEDGLLVSAVVALFMLWLVVNRVVAMVANSNRATKQ